ncbi:MAG: phospho-N-acetylmuramoyl-pentapeptide-transferase [Erysipelotrichaceae bacterium]|nr:phospho-N-acetylmuramoyl-pentapeptide-transferase [Bacillota bacterium]NLP22353.1 phospho-N-acetylmuramoyl-pentapeptide-transferase [Erysipelotrichaceae bacterium]
MYLKLFLAFIVSLLIILVTMPTLIKYLKSISFNQNVNEYALEQFKTKEKVPTMGGVLLVLVPIIVTIIFDFNALFDLDTMIILLAFLGYGIIGFIDDYLIVIRKNNHGLSAKHKFLMQLVLAFIFFMIYRNNNELSINIPIFNYNIGISSLYAILIFFMFTGSSNAVNITDGMDGLSAGCMFFSLIPFLVFALLENRMTIAIFILSLLGVLVGYLKYNVSPAKIYMGDTGSLSLGAVLAAIAMVLNKEILLIIIGGVYVWETLCVIIQIGSVKLRGKRVFKYTPIHYSFVLDGMSEKTVVKSFWLLSAIFSIVGLIIGLI